MLKTKYVRYKGNDGVGRIRKYIHFVVKENPERKLHGNDITDEEYKQLCEML